MIDLINNNVAKGAVDFLLNLYKDNVYATASIINAQADGDVDYIIRDLEDVKNAVIGVIEQLTELKYNSYETERIS